MKAMKFTPSARTAGSQQPKHRQVFEQLFNEIRTGKFGPGEPLPTEAKLVESLGFSRNTVRQALARLENDGIIERIQGRGTFVTREGQHQSKNKVDAFAFLAPQIREGSYPSLIHGFEQGCVGFQHQTIIANTGNDIGRQADFILQMIDQSIGGVAIVPTTAPATPAHQIRQLQKNDIPVVMCHRTVDGISAPSIVFSGFEIGQQAGEIFVQNGHRRAAILYAHRYAMVTDRLRGIQSAFRDAGIDEASVLDCEYGASIPAPDVISEQAIQKVIVQLMTQENRPTAIFCQNGPDAEVVYLQLQSIGLKVPEDISLLYFGSTWREHGLAGKISSIAVDEHKIGSLAVQLLHEMRIGRRAIDSTQQFVFPITYVQGETVDRVRN